MQPLNNYMLVEPLESPKQTAGGLFLPDTVKQKPAWFRVQQVGPGLPDMFGWLQQLDYEPGDLVYVLPHSVYRADLKAYGLDSDQQVTVVSEGDVLAKIRDGDGDVLSRIEPIGSYCLIRRVQLPEKRTAGGLYLPDQAVPPPMMAEVVAVGTGYRTAAKPFIEALAQMAFEDIKPYLQVSGEEALESVRRKWLSYFRPSAALAVRAGDRVLIIPTSPLELDLQPFGIDEKYHIVGEADILCRIEL